MTEMNHQRAMVALLKQICGRRRIELTAFSGDWIFCLQKDGRTTHVFGYDFELNSASAKMICKDKAATSDLLEFHRIPRVEHRIFHGPQLAGYVPQEGSWEAMLTFLGACPGGVVCKPNEGTGGNSVFFAKNAAQLETAVYQVFGKSRSLCLSPFEEIEFEYRAAVICGKLEFIYRKIRPFLRGDGRQTIRELMLSQLREAADFPKQLEGMKRLSEMKIEWEAIPESGESVNINWRHNLGQGAQPELLTPDSPEWEPVGVLAGRAASALGVQLASVDIASTPGGLKVLEINSGIMMESLVHIHPEGWSMAEKFYDRIVCAALGIEDGR